MQITETKRGVKSTFWYRDFYRAGQFLLLLSVLLTAGALSAEENVRAEYGSKGTFDLSLGMSTASTANGTRFQSYSLFLAPYANHFLFKNWFARYELPIYYSFSDWYRSSHTVGFSPGLAFGYSFRMADAWRLNLSAGYARHLYWYFTSAEDPYYSSIGEIAFFPELKYLISPTWAAAILMRGTMNIYKYQSGYQAAVYTTTYIVLSYIF